MSSTVSFRCFGSHSNFVLTCFSSISNSLRSLDLSYNELTSLPAAALARAKSLDWLNLHG
jgi:Leucine-rich repeat (LRR) protein